jgi:hypothetical protein
MCSAGAHPGWPARSLSPGRELALVSALYLLLTAALTYPTIVRLGTHLPGSGDVPTMVWDLWALTRAILDPKVPLGTTDLLFHPLPDVKNIWTSPTNVVLCLPLTLTAGPLVTYNLNFLSSFVLAGLFCYLLVRNLTGSTLASFAAGSAFSFSAFHYAHGLGHWNLCSVQWLPLCALCLLRVHAKPDASRTLQFIVATCLVVMAFPYFGAYFLLPLLVCFFLYHAWKERIGSLGPRFLAAVAMALAAAAAGTLLFYREVLLPEPDMVTALQQSAKDTERYSADLLAFVVPSASHPLFGDLVSPLYDRFSTRGNPAEATLYIGVTALLLALWGLWRRKRQDGLVWAILAALAFVLSLGPVLHVSGKPLFPLPYALVMKLPVFSSLRAPGRLSVTMLFSVSVLAGYGLSDLLERVRGTPPVRILVAGAIVLIACFETLFSFPYQSSSTEIPEFYERMLTDPQWHALYQVPSGPGHSESTGWYMFYQVYHQRKLAIGYQAREPLPVVLFPHWLLRGRFLSPPVSLSDTDNWPAFEASFADLLAYNGITDIIVQRRAGASAESYSQTDYEEVKASLARSLGGATYEEDGLTAYEVSPVTPKALASFSGKLELIGHKVVEATECPDSAASCTFLVTFWQAAVVLPERYGLNVQLVRHNRDSILAETSHDLGLQFTLGEEVACYNTSWWAPGVVVSDYALLPSTDAGGLPLSGSIDIKIRITEPKAGVMLNAQSEDYAIDEQGRLLVENYRTS